MPRMLTKDFPRYVYPLIRNKKNMKDINSLTAEEIVYVFQSLSPSEKEIFKQNMTLVLKESGQKMMNDIVKYFTAPKKKKVKRNLKK